MNENLTQLHSVFERARNGIQAFMDILSPAITNAAEGHQRLYYHHIFEEEEQHMDRLNQFVPKLGRFIESKQNLQDLDNEVIALLQDLNLEKFGLHNFLEHLELAMYEFKDGEHAAILNSLLEQTKSDYLAVKEIVTGINQNLLPKDAIQSAKLSDLHNVESVAHDHEDHSHEEHDHHHHEQIAPPINNAQPNPVLPIRKGLTVGSLKMNE
jgi:hypothetical protein